MSSEILVLKIGFVELILLDHCYFEFVIHFEVLCCLLRELSHVVEGIRILRMLCSTFSNRICVF